ncbi:MAG TPA: hypothetical protein VH061_02565 [Solirubrobacteraceae bacterium]|nr:hypothetical protein [Solirubrobacteraceae bacterium]
MGRPRAFAALGALAIAAVLAVVLSSHGSAGASTTYADYSLLSSSATGGLTEVTSQEAAQAAKGPIWFGDSQSEAPQPDIGSARLASTDVSGLQVWVAKSNKAGICVLALVERRSTGPQGPASSCNANLERGATIQLDKGTAGAHYLAGIVPNDVPAVTLTLADGTTKQVPASGNAYAAETSQSVTSVSYANAGVAETVKLGG